MPHRRNKLISLTLCLLLLLEQSGFAQSISLSLSNYLKAPKQAISDTFRPLHLRYLSYDNSSNNFQLLLDKGSSPPNSKPALEQVTQELLKYFLIGLVLPNEKFWVNLRPDSPDDILDDDLAKTDIGKVFLEADVQLKKDTAGLTSPQTKEGKVYWDKLYKKAGELFGSENITIPTLTRPWIVPDEVILRESPEGAYIYKATLKVMLEEDYLSRGGSRTAPTSGRSRTAPTLDGSRTAPTMQTVPAYQQYAFNDPRLKELNQYSTQLIRETIIPKLTQAVNTSRRYAQLRQVYYSLILAQWFKARYRSLGSQPTVDSSQNPYIKLIDSGNLTWNMPTNNSSLITKHLYSKDVYFQQYQQSFQDGEYNLQEPIHTSTGQSIRRYMSGGIGLSEVSSAMEKMPGKGGPPFGITKNMLSYGIKASAAEPYNITAKSLSISTPGAGKALDKPVILYVSEPQDLIISDDPEIKKIWDSQVLESIELHEFTRKLVSLSREYGIIEDFPRDELNNLLEFYSSLDKEEKEYEIYNLGFITANGGKDIDAGSLLSAQFKFNLLFLGSMANSKIGPGEFFDKGMRDAKFKYDEDDVRKIATGGELKNGNNFYEYTWKPFKAIKSIVWKEVGNDKIIRFFKEFESLLNIFQESRRPYYEIAKRKRARDKPYIVILEQYKDQLKELINSDSPQKYIERQEVVGADVSEGKIMHMPGLTSPNLPGEARRKVTIFKLPNGQDVYAKRVNPLRARYPEEEIMISLEVDKELKKISPYFGVQEFIGIVYDRGSFYLLSLAINKERYLPKGSEEPDNLIRFKTEVSHIINNVVDLPDPQNFTFYKNGKIASVVYFDFESLPYSLRQAKGTPDVREGRKTSSAVSSTQMLRWINEILSAKKSAREIFSQLDEEERKYLMRKFDEIMGYRFDPGSPGFLRGHVLADDKNMRKLLTVARELDERFNKEGFSYIYILGRSLRFVGKALELLNNPGNKAYTHIPFSGGWYENMAGSGDLVETPDKPEAAQVEAYGESLSRIGFDPREIIKRPGKTVILEYVDKGEGLKSFLWTLLELAKLKGMGEEELLKLKSRLTVYALVKKSGQEVNLSREQFFNFEIIPFQVDDELLRGMASTDEFKDSIGASYPMDKWQNPPEYEMTENAFLVLMQIVRHMETENASASVSAAVEERGGIDLTRLADSVKSSLSPSFTADMPLSGPTISLDFSLGNQLIQIQDMLKAGIMPSDNRVMECVLASSSLDSRRYGREIDLLFGCIADIFKLEEEKARPTPKALKDALILLESNKSA